jgi:apolipoprotein N-acyltransferase
MTPTTDTPRRLQAEQLLAIASAFLLPLGLAMILLSWYGASHTPYLFEQVPYLISGGLLGLGLALVGGLVYFGSWIARGAAEQRRQGEQVVALLRDIRDDLRSIGATGDGLAPCTLCSPYDADTARPLRTT